jgi:hypothetical protein
MTELSAGDRYWEKYANSALRFALPMVGAAIFINSGYQIYEITLLRDTVRASSKIVCHSDVTLHMKKSRYPVTYITDQKGNELRHCSGFECSYHGFIPDLGKRAKLCYSGEVLVSAEVNGVSRLTRDERLDDMTNRIWLNKIMVLVALFCFGISVYLERRNIRSLARRFSQYFG